MGVIESMAEEMGMQILKKAPEYAAKFVLGTVVGVAVHFASEKLIKEANKFKRNRRT